MACLSPQSRNPTALSKTAVETQIQALPLWLSGELLALSAALHCNIDFEIEAPMRCDKMRYYDNEMSRQTRAVVN